MSANTTFRAGSNVGSVKHTVLNSTAYGTQLTPGIFRFLRKHCIRCTTLSYNNPFLVAPTLAKDVGILGDVAEGAISVDLV
jgi:hypothetical protein